MLRRTVSTWTTGAQPTSVVSEKYAQTVAERLRPLLPTGPAPIPEAQRLQWIGESPLVAGKVACVSGQPPAPTSAYTFGHLLPEAINSGMGLVVISDVTTPQAAMAYALEHGYSHSPKDLVVLSRHQRIDGSGYWAQVWDYVLGDYVGLRESVESALEIMGRPTVVVVEQPEDLLTQQDVEWESYYEPDAASLRTFIRSLEEDVLRPDGHALVWSTASAVDTVHSEPRRCRAVVEDAVVNHTLGWGGPHSLVLDKSRTINYRRYWDRLSKVVLRQTAESTYDTLSDTLRYDSRQDASIPSEVFGILLPAT